MSALFTQGLAHCGCSGVSLRLCAKCWGSRLGKNSPGLKLHMVEMWVCIRAQSISSTGKGSSMPRCSGLYLTAHHDLGKSSHLSWHGGATLLCIQPGLFPWTISKILLASLGGGTAGLWRVEATSMARLMSWLSLGLWVWAWRELQVWKRFCWVETSEIQVQQPLLRERNQNVESTHFQAYLRSSFYSIFISNENSNGDNLTLSVLGTVLNTFHILFSWHHPLKQVFL